MSSAEPYSGEWADVTARIAEVDRTDWIPGPWDDEPDRLYWIDAETGLDCLILRNHVGALCGYVGVPEGHPLYGLEWNTDAIGELRAHGGVNFTSACNGRVCHTPQPGRGEVWWLGFDCSHGWDTLPWMAGDIFPVGDYRTLPYVRAQTIRLAAQAGAYPTPPRVVGSGDLAAGSEPPTV